MSSYSFPFLLNECGGDIHFQLKHMIINFELTKTYNMKLKSSCGLLLLGLAVACSAPKKEENANETADEPVALEVSVTGESIDYKSDTTTMKGYIAYDKNDTAKSPGILVVHEWWGHNEHARNQADKLAELGYVALAVDMYGDGKQAAHPGEAGEFAGMVMGNFETARARFESALDALKSNAKVDSEKIGAIGFCFGGSVVLSMANAGYDLDAVAAFHAGLQLPVMPDSGSVKAKILVANGAADPMIPEQQVADFKSAMDAAGVDYKYISYEGVMHAFTNKEADSLAAKFEIPLAYDAAADSASWEEMKIFFANVF